MSEKSPDNSTNKTDANYLKLLQEASRVSRLAWLEDDKELGTIATSGLRCLESSKNLNPAGLLQKMSEALLISNTAWSSNVCTLIWKVKATKRKRLLYQLQASVPRTAETESGLWRTPDALSGGSNLPGIKKALDQGHLKRPSGQPIQIRLHDQVREKRLWPTPRANKVFPHITEKNREKLATRNKANLEEVIAGHCGQKTGTLNPTWVEWLMGYKAGYTDLKDWEILSSRKSQKK